MRDGSITRLSISRLRADTIPSPNDISTSIASSVSRRRFIPEEQTGLALQEAPQGICRGKEELGLTRRQRNTSISFGHIERTPVCLTKPFRSCLLLDELLEQVKTSFIIPFEIQR